MANHFVDTLRGLATLKLFGRDGAAGEEVYATSERFREATVQTLRAATLSSLVLDLAGTCALAAVAIMLGFRLMDGSVALMPALAALVAVPECFGAVRRFSADFHASLDGRNALAEIFDMLRDGDAGEQPAGEKAASTKGTPGEGPVGEKAVPAEGPAAPVAPWSASSVLRLRGAGFSYASADGAHRALEGVDLELRGFERLGVVGVSGSGKSTLASLLAGFAAPDRGAVELDGAVLPGAGLCRADWRAQVAYIPQAPHLFSATLRDNLAFYRPDASEDEVLAAVRAVGLDGLLAELPHGLETPVGQGGRQLSGGQAQRVALARALLDSHRRVWVLDEPTAHLDVETELALKECMLPLMEGRAVVLATHRLHWMGAMDRVLVLEEGWVAQVGTPAELCADPQGAYARLARRMGVDLR